MFVFFGVCDVFVFDAGVFRCLSYVRLLVAYVFVLCLFVVFVSWTVCSDVCCVLAVLVWLFIRFCLCDLAYMGP